MENYKLVLPEHMNQFGYLFGGNLLKWIDEVAWIAASLDFPGCKFVTIAMDRIEFRKSVKDGSILRFLVERSKIGKTSVQYVVSVFNADNESGGGKAVFSTHVTFVRLDDEGNKAEIPKCLIS